MYCFKCGTQILDGSLFCSNCGAAQNAGIVKAPSQTNVAVSTELDREAAKLYLSNVLALECMKVQLEEELREAERELKYEQDNNYLKRYPISNGYVWLIYHEKKMYVGAFTDGESGGGYTGEYLNREEHVEGNGFIKYVWGEPIITHGGDFYWAPINDDTMSTISKPSFWWDIGGSNFLQQKIRQLSAKDGFLEAYGEFKVTAPAAANRKIVEVIRPLEKKVKDIESELNKADELLQKAYDINIIPKQFRELYAVWFIHDFITTSHETLSSAFLHCDLDEIKQKLDEIIEQNNQIIVQQAIQIAQNAQLMEKNQQMLNRLANIEQNTERAAQYAEIAANNAEACAWISLANYIDKK